MNEYIVAECGCMLIVSPGKADEQVKCAVCQAQDAVRSAACSCGEPGVGSLVQCDWHHGVGCYCLACVA